MINYRNCLIVTLITLVASVSYAKQPASKPVNLADNAALSYWQAFAVMPTLTDKESKAVNNFRSCPLDKTAESIIKKADSSLRMLRRGAKYSQCYWGLERGKGEDTLLTHPSVARQLAKIAVLRARYNIIKNRPAEGIADLMATLTLGRHVGADGPIISYMVQTAIEDIVIEAAADSLMIMKPADLKLLAISLNNVPVGGTFATAIEQEKDFFIPSSQLNQPKTKVALELWKTLAPIAELPPQQFKNKLNGITSDNPLFKEMTQGIQYISYFQAASRTKMDMLKAAIRIRLEGSQAVSVTKDIYGDGPYKYEKLPSGFKLTSDFKNVKGDVVELTIGKEQPSAK